jgi:hypothetical protein
MSERAKNIADDGRTTIEFEGDDCFVTLDGEKIAILSQNGLVDGLPNWILLRPGYTVHQTADFSRLWVEETLQ